jgi:GMP synthase-like glutamine amidotransferase
LIAMRVLALIHQEDAAAGVFADEIDTLDEASFALGRPPSRDDHDATIVFGGEVNVDEEDAHPWMREEKAFIADLVAEGRPVLGVCLGAQLLAEAAGARVGPLPDGPEIGWREVERVADDPVLGALPPRFLALEWHGYHSGLPPGAVELARNGVGLQAFRLGDRPAWGIQFHAEVTARDLDRWTADEDDPDPTLAGTPLEIGRWNELGRRLCRAFLLEAANRR